jgi:hypothetical protein
MAKRFATGLVTGEADDVASPARLPAIFVFGDIRDVVREGKRLAMGEEADQLVLGLASAGLVVTAATYVSAGGATPVRAGLSMVKDARKVGRWGLTEWAGRSARGVVDAPMLQKAVADASLARQPDYQCDESSVQGRESRSACSPRERRRACRRESRHQGRARCAAYRGRAEGCRACGTPRRIKAVRPAPS